MISMWHEEQEPGSGFLNAYVYPGFNKVLQAAGRVIRTMDDRGFVLFLDNRYFHKRYEALFAEGTPVYKARTIGEVKPLLFDFHL